MDNHIKENDQQRSDSDQHHFDEAFTDNVLRMVTHLLKSRLDKSRNFTFIGYVNNISVTLKRSFDEEV